MEQKTKTIGSLVFEINHGIHLPSFIESLTGKTVKMRKDSESALMNCPFSWHNDRNASFRIKQMDDGAWTYFCFGCKCKGMAVRFFMEYTGEEDKEKAVNAIRTRFKIENLGDPSLYRVVTRRIDKKRIIETSHILVASQCRTLLRKDLQKNKKWVEDAYKRLNKALDEGDSDTIESIGYEASGRI